jgi:ABC-type Zn2+ transport system substrate-binding protein/surface adhesin
VPGKPRIESSVFFFVSASEEEEETPMEHIMETFSGTDSILQEHELDRFLHALQTGGKSEEEDAHAGHDDHEEEAHAHDDHEEEAHADHPPRFRRKSCCENTAL